MQQFIESSPRIWWLGAGLRTVMAEPSITEPLLLADSQVDEAGASFPTVIHDGGRYRMWYGAWQWTKDYRLSTSDAVGYAESDDGIEWKKPVLGIVEHGGDTRNNLVDLPLSGPSVFIDPTAPASHRYRAFGNGDPKGKGLMNGWSRKLVEYGFYTAHSADGFHWEVDSALPRWLPGDTCSACWDEYRQCARYGFRQVRSYAKVRRRDVYTAEMRAGEFTNAEAALVPDDFDDLIARQLGGVSADYYFVSWLPQEDVTFGLLHAFYHEYASEPPKEWWNGWPVLGGGGTVHLRVVYQEDGQGGWRHLPGRRSFIGPTGPGTLWEHGLYASAYVVRAGDEHRLYICANQLRHSHGPNPERTDQQRVLAVRRSRGTEGPIALARWPAGRLVGLRSDFVEELELRFDGDEVLSGMGLYLNAKTYLDGVVRIGLYDTSLPENREKGTVPIPGYAKEDCIPIIGDHLKAQVRWRGGCDLPLVPHDFQLGIRFSIDTAAVYQFGIGASRSSAGME